MKIGIIGLGYVGKAVREYFKNKISVFSFDVNSTGTESSLVNLAKKSDLLFICLPTPMNQNGSCNIEIVESVLQELNNLNFEKKINVVIKSTVPVGTTNYFSDKYKQLIICFNPEFLTEKNFVKDFFNQKRILIGRETSSKIVEELYNSYFPQSEIIILKSKEAEIIKYISNSFLALKVSYANEIYEFCKAKGIKYKNIVNVLEKDERLGNSHWQVPGPDKKRGYGGTCFPKDISSLINQFEESNIEPKILKASWNRNTTKDRPGKDWENLIGRAIIGDIND